MSAPSSPGQPIPTWVQRTTVTAVAAVALVAGAASYAHIQVLADAAGEGWRAFLTPLSVDGLLVAASMVMLVRRRAGQRAGALCWTGLAAGLVASVAANIAASQPDLLHPVPWWLQGIVTAWPPVALGVAFELLILVTRDHARATRDVPDDGETWEQRRDHLLATGTSRRRLARELEISEHEARQLLSQHAQEHPGGGRAAA